jgi:hypothetical protein
MSESKNEPWRGLCPFKHTTDRHCDREECRMFSYDDADCLIAKGLENIDYISTSLDGLVCHLQEKYKR